jgi:membrane-bound lytic murein transglycosylase B
MADTLHLEVDKANGAILSYSVTKLESKTSYFIEASEAELDFLNHLEANVLPAGMITTLADLQNYRTKKQVLAQAQAKVSQAKVKVAQSEAAVRKGQANLEAFMNAEAAKRGVSRAELESLLEDRQKRLAVANDTSNNKPSPDDDKARQSLIRQIKTRSKSKSPKE